MRLRDLLYSFAVVVGTLGWASQAGAAPIVPVYTDPVTQFVWAPGADFDGLSWANIAAACPGPTFVCAGTLNGFDVSGWTWASEAQVGTLYVDASNGLLTAADIAPGHFNPTDGGVIGQAIFSHIGCTAPAPCVISDMFTNAASGTNFAEVNGGGFFANTNIWLNLARDNGSHPTYGAALFQPTAVPEPASLSLLGLGLGGLVFRRWYRR